MAPQRLIVGISGASGVIYGIRLLEILRGCGIETHLIMTRAAEATGIEITAEGLPMRASEDFGRFATVAKTAMILLGAGENHAPLHAEDYDLPDDLIAPSVRLFERIARDLTA